MSVRSVIDMGLFAKLFRRKKQEQPVKLSNEQPKQEPVEKIEDKPCIASETSEQKKPKSVTVKAETSKKSIPEKKEDNDALADKIACDKSSTNLKVNGLSGFFEIKKAKDNRYVFNLYASNRVIIATSQIYSSSQSAVNGANSVIANAEKANIEDQTLKDFPVLPYPKWEIYKDKGSQYRFRLSASNGSCICHSQGYKSKASCKNGIESIIRTVKDAKIDKSYLAKK